MQSKHAEGARGGAKTKTRTQEGREFKKGIGKELEQLKRRTSTHILEMKAKKKSCLQMSENQNVKLI